MSRKSFWCKWSHILSSTTAICKWGLNQCLENLGNFRRKHVFCDPQMHCYWSLTFWISKILFDISFSLSPSPFLIFIYIYTYIYIYTVDSAFNKLGYNEIPLLKKWIFSPLTIIFLFLYIGTKFHGPLRFAKTKINCTCLKRNHEAVQTTK